MAIYLNDVPLNVALENFYHALEKASLKRVLGIEVIPLDENACTRILAEPVWAKISSPHYNASAMDGFAVSASATAGAQPTSPVDLLCSGEIPQAAYLDTGDPLPDWADAVIPIEDIEPLNEAGEFASNFRTPHRIRIRSAVAPWSHVRPLGEDIIATQLVLPAGHEIRPVDLGAIAACGHTHICVAIRPRVAILPTGSELILIGEEVQAGDIIEFNSLVLAGQINAWGGQANRYPITHDNLDSILERTREAAAAHDLVLINAGSSAGAEDFTVEVVKKLGQLVVHGIAVRPGHPVILGILSSGNRSVPVIGVPGYPVSTAMTGEIIIRPLLEMWLGKKAVERETIQASLTRKITSPPGDDDYVRVAVGKVGGRYLAAPLSRGAGVITSLVRADGIVVIERGLQGLPAGSGVTVQLYRPKSEIDRTILAIGSHDLCLDVMAQYLASQKRNLSSANVGSQGGLVALQRQECHLAGSHLLDPSTGEYNLSYLKKYLPGTAVKVIGFVYRQQGLIVQKGNPKRILGIDDLNRGDIFFCNRQRGAGTRVLLDYQLAQSGIHPHEIQGYNHEEFTHLGVAASVASGRSDCGLGIAAAAYALKLDFIPVEEERYDLVIPDEYFVDKLLQPLLDLLTSNDFRASIMMLPGYNTEPMGKLINEYNPGS
jgi:putative molybdopterin biosynthesis protein